MNASYLDHELVGKSASTYVGRTCIGIKSKICKRLFIGM